MVDQGAVLVDDDNDGDLSIDHNKRIRPTMRAIMAAHMVNLLSTKEVQELSGPHPKALCFPDDYRMQQGYTSLHERVKKMLEDDPTLWVNKQGIPSVPTRRACREKQHACAHFTARADGGRFARGLGGQPKSHRCTGGSCSSCPRARPAAASKAN